MKGVILAAGMGNRMLPLTRHIPKCMLPVADRPILEWGIALFRDELLITDIMIVVGYKKEKIIKHFGDGSKFGVNITYKVQDLESCYGLGAALKLAQGFVGEDFVLLLGDNLYKGPFKLIMDEHYKLKSKATIHIEEVANPSRYGVVVHDPVIHKKILKLVEKPQDPPSNDVITGFYVLNKVIFEALDNIILSTRGELELTDALNYVAQKDLICGIKIDGWRKDFGYPIDLLDAAKWYLDNGNSSVIESELDESVVIVNPVYIGKNCNIKNSRIGPYSTIGSNVFLNDTVITHSVVLEGVKIENETLIDTIADEMDLLKVKLINN